MSDARDGARGAAIRAAREEDRAAILELLAVSGLPAAGFADAFPGGYVVADAAGRVLAAAGLEVHGDAGLLRSVVVMDDVRGSGLGARLVGDRLDAARARGLGAVYLLTTGAAGWFARLGFEPLERAAAPPELGASEEWKAAACASARLMVRALTPAVVR